MEFVLFFITGPSRAKLGRTAWQQLLTLALLYVSDGFHLILIWNCKHLNKFIGIVMKKWIMNKLITGPIFGSQEKWTVEAFHTLNSGTGCGVLNSGYKTIHIWVPWTQILTKLFARGIIDYLMKPQNFLASLDLFLGHNNHFFAKVSILTNCGEKKEDFKIACWNFF